MGKSIPADLLFKTINNKSFNIVAIKLNADPNALIGRFMHVLYYAATYERATLSAPLVDGLMDFPGFCEQAVHHSLLHPLGEGVVILPHVPTRWF